MSPVFYVAAFLLLRVMTFEKILIYISASTPHTSYMEMQRKILMKSPLMPEHFMQNLKHS